MGRIVKIVLGVVALVAVAVGGLLAYVSTMDFNGYKGLIAEKVKEFTGRELAIAGNIDLRLFSPALTVEGVSFANAAWGSRKEMVKLGRVEAEVALMPLLGGTIQVDRVILKGLDALIETDKKGKGNWEFDAMAKPAEQPAKQAAPADKGGAGALPVIRSVLLEDIKVTYKDGKTGEATTVDIKSLTARADSAASPLEFALTMLFNGAPIKVDGKVGPVADVLAGGKPYPIELGAEAFKATASVKGAIADVKAAKGIDLKLAAKVGNLADTFQAVQAALPALKGAGPVPPTGIDVSAGIKDVAGGYAVQGLALKAGGSDLAGNVTAKIGGAKPEIQAALTFETINLADFTGPAKAEPEARKPEAKKEGDKKTGAKVFPADPLPLDGLKAVDADLSLKGKKLVAQNIEVGNVNLALSLRNGKLIVDPLGAALSGGTVGGSVVLDGSSGKTASLIADLKVDKLGTGALLKQLTGNPIITGAPTNATVKLRGSGGSVASLMGSLNGSVMVDVGKGEIDNAYIDLAGGDVFSQGLAALSGEKKKTELSCAVLNLGIKDGLARMDKGLGVETTAMVVQGDGEINLKSEELGVTVHPRMLQTVGVSAGGIAKLVKLTGTLAEPTVGIDAAGAAKAAATVAGAVATGGLSLLVESVVDKAGEDDHPCATASGKAPPPAKKKADEGKAASQPAPVEQKVESIGGALKGLFGK